MSMTIFGTVAAMNDYVQYTVHWYYAREVE
jgi:hypothetical protein